MIDISASAYRQRLPWHERQWREIDARIGRGRLPHALLLRGAEGLGKVDFACYLAAALLCGENAGAGEPCGRCRSCRLIQAGNHPDLIHVGVLAEKKSIGVDQIRELIDKLALTAQYAAGKIVIIAPADALNHNAANSLLKTLEEPPAGAFLLLCSSRPASLPATIRSRCQQLLFQPPDREQARQWLTERLAQDQNPDELLQLAANAPLTALHFSETGLVDLRQQLFTDLEGIVSGQSNPSIISEQWLKLGLKESLYCLYSWTVDIIRLAMSGSAARVADPEIRPRLHRLAEMSDVRRLYRRLDKACDLLNRLDQTFNPQLMLEDILIDWSIK